MRVGSFNTNLCRAIGRLPQWSSPASRVTHRRTFCNGVVEEHDMVTLTRTGANSDVLPVLTPPLCPGSVTNVVRQPSDAVFHNHIIGRPLYGVVYSKRGREYRITEPSLGEYTDLTPRLVTPIYSQDAALIVNLLDLHPSVPAEEKLEIFEAGTGHGALTLHLARAIHAANTQLQEGTTIPKTEQLQDPEGEAYKRWLSDRKAIVQTLDINPENSKHAQNLIKNYRHGIYYPNVNFHVGTIEEYITARLRSENKPFLTHAILDLPDCHKYMDLVAGVLKPAGSLLVFCPSITQINVCALQVKENGCRLYLDKVVEIGAGVGAGGREWDVRPVRPRALLKAKAAAEAKKSLQETIPSTTDTDAVDAEVNSSVAATGDVAGNDGWELVCRPKVRKRVVGGGFVGVWKKMNEIKLKSPDALVRED